MGINEIMPLKSTRCVLHHVHTQQNDPTAIIFIRENNGWSSWETCKALKSMNTLHF